MAHALVLSMQPLGIDGETQSARGSFLVDNPPLGSIPKDDIFKSQPPIDYTQDIQSFWPAGAMLSQPPMRRSSLASAASPISAARMFLSLSASTRNFFGHKGDILISEKAGYNRSKITKLQKPHPTSTLTPTPIHLDALRADVMLPKDWLSVTEETTILETEITKTECTLSDRKCTQEKSSGDPLEGKTDTFMATVNCEVVSEVQHVGSPTNVPLSFASGSLRYSKRSTLTLKSKSSSTVLDDATIARIRKRRDLIEELLQTEEVYISELRTLLNVYFGSINDDIYPFTEKKAMFIRSIGGILELHERLYQAMQHAIPRSLEARQAPWDTEAQIACLPSPFNIANPAAAALLANSFDETMKDLLAYEDFISKYDAMLKDGYIFKSNPHRRSWERDCELLSSYFLSKSNKLDQGKRALTFEDLLMKPIQRICKYPLFFTELLRVTPVIDCPESNAILDKVNQRVKERIAQLDMAKDNSPKLREKLERTWLLQKRLSFKDKLGPLPRLLGQIILCGPLFATWKDGKGLHGEYIACLLYKSYLLLATVSKSDSTLNVILAISLLSARIEEASLGTGIQCHNAPFSWILAFENDFRLYEIILSAWNAREEEVWRKNLAERIDAENRDCGLDGSPTQRTLFVRPIACSIESSGSTISYNGALRRHWSFHGSIAIPPRNEPIVVSIQNTWAPSEAALQPRTRSSQGLNRSSSVVNMSNVFTLSPKRSTRSRVENAMTDVWSKDQLPPGASSWLAPRKFSMGNIATMASLTSSFGRKASPGLNSEPSTPIKNRDGDSLGGESKTKSEKRRSISVGPVEWQKNASSKAVDAATHSFSPKESSVKESKTPMTPIRPSWGSSKSKESPTVPSTLSVKSTLGDRGTWKKRWSNTGNVMRFFECDGMFPGA